MYDTSQPNNCHLDSENHLACTSLHDDILHVPSVKSSDLNAVPYAPLDAYNEPFCASLIENLCKNNYAHDNVFFEDVDDCTIYSHFVLFHPLYIVM